MSSAVKPTTNQDRCAMRGAHESDVPMGSSLTTAVRCGVPQKERIPCGRASPTTQDFRENCAGGHGVAGAPAALKPRVPALRREPFRILFPLGALLALV